MKCKQWLNAFKAVSELEPQKLTGTATKLLEQWYSAGGDLALLRSEGIRQNVFVTTDIWWVKAKNAAMKVSPYNKKLLSLKCQ